MIFLSKNWALKYRILIIIMLNIIIYYEYFLYIYILKKNNFNHKENKIIQLFLNYKIYWIK